MNETRMTGSGPVVPRGLAERAVQIADGRLKSIATVGDAAALVQELTREKAGASA